MSHQERQAPARWPAPARRSAPPRWPAAAWWLVVAGAVPLAASAAALGFAIPVTAAWPRDLALLMAWSVCEEIVFRGGAQPVLARWPTLARRGPWWGISAANALTSVLFAAAHLWSKPPAVALALLPVSLLLGASLERGGGRLVVPAALHAYFNALLFAMSAWRVG
jgi:membrane protease YdiL (CAAX protease family)